jgi:uncharacterized membrane protein
MSLIGALLAHALTVSAVLLIVCPVTVEVGVSANWPEWGRQVRVLPYVRTQQVMGLSLHLLAAIRGQ